MTKQLLQRKESVKYPGLFVKKYTRKVFFDNLWHTDPALMEARGHVEDKDGNIVIRPFTKIFNRGENGTDIHRDEKCLAIRKVNGFMAAATYVPTIDKVVVSTTGSLDSPFVEIAEKYITEDVKAAIKQMSHQIPATMLFEICDPTDPHIINEEYGAYLIGCRRVGDERPYFSDAAIETGLDFAAESMKFRRPEWTMAVFSDVIKAAKNCNHEGYVVYGQESRVALKIKSPYYLVMKACARKKDIMSLNKEIVDEEYYPLIDYLKEHQDEFNSLDEQQRLEYMTDWIMK